MQNVLTFFVVLFILSVGVAGFTKLALIVIKPGEIFGRWQNVLKWLDRKQHTTKAPFKFWFEFMYKSLGGCDTCARQRLAEITFAMLCIMWQTGWYHGAFYMCPMWVRVILQIGIYLLFCGMVMFWGQVMDIERKPTTTGKLSDDTIFEQVAPQPQKKSK